MASVEQIDARNSLSDTLDFFANYKTIDEDKDSDEESFHLPMLDCEDEVHNGKGLQNGETEEEILNKFENSDTPDVVDPKIEDSILNEDEELPLEKNSDVNIETKESLNGENPSEVENGPSEIISKNDWPDDSMNGKNINQTDKEQEINGQLEEPKERVYDIKEETLGVDNNSSAPEQITENSEVVEESVPEKMDEEPEKVEEEPEKVEEEPKEVKEESEKIDEGSEKVDEGSEKLEEESEKIEESEEKVCEESVKIDKELEKVNEESKKTEEECEKAYEEPEKVDAELEKIDEKSEKVDDESEQVDDEREKVDVESERVEVDDESEKVDDEKIKVDDESDKVGDERVKVDDELEQVVDEPQQVVDEPEKVDDESEKVDRESEQMNEEPEKMEEDSEKVDKELVQIDEEPEKMDEESEEMDSKPEPIAELTINKELNLEDAPVDDIPEKSPPEEPSTEVKENNDITNEENIDKLESTAMETDNPPIETPEKMETEIDNETSTPDKPDDTLDEDVVMELEEPKASAESTDKINEVIDEEKINPAETTESNESNNATDIVAATEKIEESSQQSNATSDRKSPVPVEESPAKLTSEAPSTTKETNENLEETSKPADDNLACDDLLDISIIRDVDEDNANAVAESNEAQNAQISDKSDDDDKADNEIEESEVDQEENFGSSDKDDHMDFDDGTSSNLCMEESSTNDNINDSTSDSVNKTVVGVSSVKDKIDAEIGSSVLDTNNILSQKVSDNLTPDPLDEPPVYLDLDKHMAEQALKDQSFQLHGKRSLSQDDIQSDSSSKKLKLSESASDKDTKDPASETKNEVKTLLTFAKFMMSKKFNQKLTKSDLEQFCIQKICETIVDRTNIGEMHQTIKKQEQIIDTLRKEIQQLAKQARDLDIVHKKLMNELRSQNGNKKPLVPLKITRSVGLQVKLNVPEQPARKKQTTAPSTPNRSTPTTPVNRSRPAAIPANNNVVRQVNTNSPRKPATPTASQSTATSTPILNQVLQNAARPVTTPVANRPQPIKPKPAEPPKQSSQGGGNAGGVIDLTDEDDKTSKTNPPAPVKILNKTLPIIGQPKVATLQMKSNTKHNAKPSSVNKTVNGPSKASVTPVKTVQTSVKGTTPARAVTTLPQGVRLTSTQVKNGIAIPASVVTSNAAGGPQLMYVVQPSQLVTTTAGGQQKTVLLNFQPGNSILTSTLNGSAVSVIPTKQTNTVQLKTVAPTIRKHPAALPSPPFIPNNPLLKPVLPKPHLSIRKTDTGIILQWRMPYNLDLYEAIASYQLYAYQETNSPPSTEMWRKVGDVKALALPMACTLTQFADKNKYYFAVRSIDVHKRIGAFSDPEEISL